MSDADWFRERYGVPADLGRRVAVMGVLGVIVGYEGPYLRVRHEGTDHVGSYHPRWGVVYDPPEAPLYRDHRSRRAAVLEIICRADHHVSAAEVATATGVTKGIAHGDLAWLRDQGLVDYEPVRRHHERRGWTTTYHGYFATDAGLAWLDGDAGQASLETA
jgi:hypothetical protein